VLTLVGSLGLRVEYNAILAFKAYAQNYRTQTAARNCDRILMIAFSRGCATALKTAKLIEAMDLPRRGDDQLYKKLYELCLRDTYTEAEIQLSKKDTNGLRMCTSISSSFSTW